MELPKIAAVVVGAVFSHVPIKHTLLREEDTIA